MWVTVFAFVAACITIFVAGRLVHRQRLREEELKRIEEGLLMTLDNAVNDVEILTSEELSERTLTYLEKRLDTFDKSLSTIQPPKQELYRKSKKGGKKGAKLKDKKYFTDD